MTEFDLLDKRAYADKLGVTERTVDRWLGEKRIQPDWRTPGGSPRFRWPPLIKEQE